MKTLMLSLVLIFGLSAINHGKPINEIYSAGEPIFEEEAYVNDIPFDTWEIAVDAILGGDEVKLEEEPYINDIPFDTRTIACKFLLRKMLETSGEANVNDIPFSTEKVWCQYLADLLTIQYRNEQNINDIPRMEKIIFTHNKCNQAGFTLINPSKAEMKIEVNKGEILMEHTIFIKATL